jgi:hypothetical protein
MGQCKSEHQGFKKARESMRQWKSWGKGFKRDYAKEKLIENMVKSKSKERGFKEYWSKVLKEILEARF